MRREAGTQGKSEIDECLDTFLTTSLHLARTKAGGCDSQHLSPSRGNRMVSHIQGHPHMRPLQLASNGGEGPHVFDRPSRLACNCYSCWKKKDFSIGIIHNHPSIILRIQFILYKQNMTWPYFYNMKKFSIWKQIFFIFWGVIWHGIICYWFPFINILIILICIILKTLFELNVAIYFGCKMKNSREA